jgi:hypothetical protein
MTESPKLNYLLRSAEELNALFLEHKVAEKIALCSSESFHEPQSLMHETFCCKKNTTVYYDATTKVEVAQICEQTLMRTEQPPETRLTISKLVIGNDVFLLRIP